MPPAPLPTDEPARLESLSRLGPLSCVSDQQLDVLVGKAARAVQVPTVLVTVLDEHRMWIVARIGFAHSELARELAFCGHTIRGADPLVIEDATLDARVMDNALVTGAPGIRFYAGIPIPAIDGPLLGALCAIDYRPRRITPHQLRTLRSVAAAVTARLAIRQVVMDAGAAASPPPPRPRAPPAAPVPEKPQAFTGCK